MDVVEITEKKEEEWEHTVQKPQSDALYEVISEWLTRGPRRSYRIPQQSRARYVAKNVAQKSWRPYLIQPDYCNLLRPRASQNSNPARSASSRTTCQTEDFFLCQHSRLSDKSSLDETKNGSRRLKKKLESLC